MRTLALSLLASLSACCVTSVPEGVFTSVTSGTSTGASSGSSSTGSTGSTGAASGTSSGTVGDSASSISGSGTTSGGSSGTSTGATSSSGSSSGGNPCSPFDSSACLGQYCEYTVTPCGDGFDNLANPGTCTNYCSADPEGMPICGGSCTSDIDCELGWVCTASGMCQGIDCPGQPLDCGTGCQPLNLPHGCAACVCQVCPGPAVCDAGISCGTECCTGGEICCPAQGVTQQPYCTGGFDGGLGGACPL